MKITKYINVFLISFLLITIGTIYSCKEKSQNNNSETEQINVQLFAATGAMVPSIEICYSFETNNNIKVDKNFAASGALARQIKAGAEADIYISANKQWIDYLIENNSIVENTAAELAGNKLVVICKKDLDIKIKFTKEFDIKSTIKDNISMGDPKYVPVGKYAKQVLDSLDWFNKIQTNIILAKDVTSVLHYVEMGECDWGIVYYSEAIKSDKIKIAYEIPLELYDPIIFYIALLNENTQTAQLYQYFLDNTAKNILKKNGFNK
ncbi:MAG: molybdate ABC transporter substrate-binding protein [Bacteroidales bacterium]|nr:molybdate ABC transporter substrate-binding protein [Bacteroidales bacterium]